MSTGKVYLVGAGPGDPGLMTQKGLECLASADVIVYDRLLDESVLGLARPDAEKIYVGKAAGEHTLPQDEINRLLVARAKEGKTVLRLKGGDPFVFGRGGEEAEVLVENGIPFEVVPGVTSAVAVPAYAGIPVTHRGVATSFAVITGHEDPGKEKSGSNWEKLATGLDTLVFLMGMQNLARITAKLVENGRPAATPVAVVKDGTRPGQQTVVGTLANINDKVKESGLGPPAVVIVGEVVRLREKLRWFDNRPLFGKRVLVTRARQQASALSKLLAERGAEPIELPAIEIKPVEDTGKLDEALRHIEKYRWTIFTSVNAVDVFFRRLRELGRDARTLHNVNIGAIGLATAGILESKGIKPDFLPEDHTSDGLLAGLRGRDIKGETFLLPRADIADKSLADGIRGMGGAVDEIAVYRTAPAYDSMLRVRELFLSGGIDIITFASSSTVTNLVAALDGKARVAGKIITACIGPKTAETAARAGLRVDIVAREQTIDGLVSAIEEYFAREEA